MFRNSERLSKPWNYKKVLRPKGVGFRVSGVEIQAQALGASSLKVRAVGVGRAGTSLCDQWSNAWYSNLRALIVGTGFWAPISYRYNQLQSGTQRNNVGTKPAPVEH